MSAGDDRAPLFSTRADEPEVVDRIDDFVVALAERIDALQDAQCNSDLPTLAELASRLATDAIALGFPLLGNGAAALDNACRDDKAEEAHQALVELTEMAHRIRLGHRGAL